MQSNDDALWDHTLAAHPEDVPPDDGEARDSFRRWLRTEATSPRLVVRLSRSSGLAE